MNKKTAVEWLIDRINKDYEENGRLRYAYISNVFIQAKQMEKEQIIDYKISTPLGHVAHCIEKYGIEIAIEEYKCKLANNKDSFWEECLAIAKFYKQFNNK
jgi:hypothetical protein